MANARELLPLFKTAIADVIQANPAGTTPMDVTYALKALSREWVMPERKVDQGGFIPTDQLPEGGNGGGTPEPPALTVTSVQPPSTVVGQAVELTVAGTGFVDSSKVSLDGNQLVTTFVSDHELTASAPGPFQAGIVELTVDGSDPIPFEVLAATRVRER